MKGIVVKGEKGKPILVWEEVADVIYGDDEVLVTVAATAVNRADLSQAKGNYPPPPGASEILGLEMAGVVEAMGDKVTGWRGGRSGLCLAAGWRLRAAGRCASRYAHGCARGLAYGTGGSYP